MRETDMTESTVEVPQSLAEVSVRLAEVDVEIAASKERLAELERPLRAEQAKNERLRDEKERLLQALEVSKRAYAILQARAAIGDSEAQPVIIVRERERNRGKFGLPKVWELVALSADGVGLYKHAPPKVENYRGKLRNMRPSDGYAIPRESVPEAVIAIIERDAEFYAEERRIWDGEDYSNERTRKIAALRKEREETRKAGYEAEGLDKRAEVKDDPASGLVMWQARGKGDWGNGSGSYKPLVPPTGGRWRWLKVEEQHELPVSEEVA